MRVLPLVLAPVSVLAGILPTFSIPGWPNANPTMVKASSAAAVTGAPISKPLGISISSVTYSGKGCPSGSVSTSQSADKTVSLQGFAEISLKRGLKSKHETGRDSRIRQISSIHWARDIFSRPLQELQPHPHAQVPTGLLLCGGVQHVPRLRATRLRRDGKILLDLFLHIALRRHVQHEHERTGRRCARGWDGLHEERHDIDAQPGPEPVRYPEDRLVGLAQHREHDFPQQFQFLGCGANDK